MVDAWQNKHHVQAIMKQLHVQQIVQVIPAYGIMVNVIKILHSHVLILVALHSLLVIVKVFFLNVNQTLLAQLA